MKSRIILTYSFRDIRRVQRLREALRRHGLDVWPDKTLTPGTPAWRAEIDARLNEALCIVVVLSRDTGLSGWVRQVIDFTHRNPVPVLPVVVDGEPGHHLLVELAGEAWFDLRWSKRYKSEVSALAALIHRLSEGAAIEVHS